MSLCMARMCAGMIHASDPDCSPTGTLPESKGGKPHSSGTKSSSERRTWSGFSVTSKEPTLSRFWSGTHTTTCPKRKSDGGTEKEELTPHRSSPHAYQPARPESHPQTRGRAHAPRAPPPRLRQRPHQGQHCA